MRAEKGSARPETERVTPGAAMIRARSRRGAGRKGNTNEEGVLPQAALVCSVATHPNAPRSQDT